MNARVPLARPAEPTENELRAVWLQMRRDSWPATFEATMADALLSRLVRLTAKHPPASVRKGFTASAPAMPLPRGTTRQPPPLRQAMPACADRKRAAAGDRDDD